MNARHVLKRSDTILGLVRDSRKIRKIIGRISNLIRRKKIIRNYLASNEIRKLLLGAGPTSLDGWLSADIAPASDRVVFLDATKPFPFDNYTFDNIYSEHMIEHISWHGFLSMLQECQRVLKPGGTIRIATPDLEVLMGLHNENPLNQRYIRWITERYLRIGVYRACFVINNAFHNWGHQFLYDGELLETAMKWTGFTDIHRCSPGESDNEHLRRIESHGKNVADNDMAVFETMVFEGKSPVRRLLMELGFSSPTDHFIERENRERIAA